MESSPLNHEHLDSYSQLDDDFHDRWDPEGDFERRLLLNPTIFRLLGDVRHKRILDAGCGNGYLSRLLAQRGAEVIGVEPATGPLDYARRREEEAPLRITYLQRDLSRLGDLGQPLDAVVANMVLLDIADWRPALANCVEALAPGGVLVYSLTHPVWVPGHYPEWAQKDYVEIREYLNEYEQRGAVGVNFHRPLSTYLNETISLGCAITEIAEPRLDAMQVTEADQEIFTRLPNFIVVAARRT
ncbi:MAG: class I SAM-dependent methyltransferase [Acidimicrobiales bacterium]